MTAITPEPGLVNAVRKDLGMSWADYARTAQLTQRTDQVRTRLEKVAGFHTLGIDQGRIVASGTGAQFTSAASQANVSVRVLAGLPDAGTLADYLNAIPNGQVYALGKDLDGYVITVGSKARASLPAAPTGVRVVTAARAPKARAAIGGGQNLTASNGSTSNQCQTGLAVTDPQGQPGILTAGHCTRDGAYTQFTTTQPGNTDSTRLGALGWNQFGLPGNQPMSNEFSSDPTDYGTDLAIIAPGAGNTATAQVPTSQNSNGRISAVANPALGLPVCMRSRAQTTNNGWRCGTIAAEQARYADTTTFPDSPRGVNVFTIKNLEAIDGDSGAPVLAHNTAIGIVSAGGVEGQTQVVYAVPVNTALATYRPNTHIKLWVSQPTLTGTNPAGTNWATASWTAGQTISGKIPGDGGETVSAVTIEARLDGNSFATTTTDTTGGFTLTLPTTMDQGRHTITVTARRGADTSEPLNIATPYRVEGPIATNWIANGGPTGTLGRPVGAADCTLINNGCFQAFERALIHYSPTTGARFSRGAIQAKWASLGWERGRLGYPTADERCGLIGGGCWQPFQGNNSAIYWNPSPDPQTPNQAHAVQGIIRDHWNSTGAERGPLGYPTADERCNDNTTFCSNDFQNGQVLFSPNGLFHTLGAIGARYKGEGGPYSGRLGWPKNNEACNSERTMCWQDFDYGRMYWQRSDNSTKLITGDIYRKWNEAGQVQGVGTPTSEEICNPEHSICWQDFTDRTQLRWYTNTDTYLIRGEIKAKWEQMGGDNSLLGRPTGNEVCGLVGAGCFQNFLREDAGIYWQYHAGTHYIRGEIRKRWGASQWENGTFGYPTSDERCGLKDGGCDQLFTTDTAATPHPRTISYSPRTGARGIALPQILNQWNDNGRESGRYGYPTNEANTNQYGQWVQPFQGGWITN